MTVVVGVDAGGTGTTAAVATDGAEVARVSGTAGAVRPGRALQAASVIADAARRALAGAGKLRADVLVVGAAGAGRAEAREELRDALRGEGLADRLVVTTDVELVLAAAFGAGPGLALIAGTGSVAVARAADGRLVRAGGYGWQMGDEGSGYALGRAALAAVGQAADGRAPATELTGRLLAATRAATLDDLVGWAAAAAPAQVAALAREAVDAAARGDAVATSLVAGAARQLARLVTAVLERTPEPGPMPFALSGNLLRQGHALRQALLAELAGVERLAPPDLTADPVAGALRMGAP